MKEARKTTKNSDTQLSAEERRRQMILRHTGKKSREWLKQFRKPK